MTLVYLDTLIAFVVIMLGASLLITILNQMISAVISYRGTNLRWGVQTLLSTLAPGLAKDAKALATEVLTQPLISDSIFSRFKNIPVLGKLTERWRLAAAVSPEALAQGLRKLAEDLKTTGIPKGLKTTGNPDSGTTALMIETLLKDVDPAAARKAELLQKTFQAVAPDFSVQVDKIFEQLGTSVQESLGKLELGFNVVMKSAAQRFAMQIRLWTIGFAFILAFGAHLNTFDVLKQLWTSPELRASLVSQSEAMLKEASVLLAAQGGATQSSAPSVSPQVLQAAMKKLIEKEKEATKGLGAVPEFKDMAAAEKWLRDGLKVDDKRKDELVTEYRNQVPNELRTRAEAIQKKLAEGGFQLIPTPYPGFHYKGPRDILGILISAAFLSLGAPFWFNALKTLSNLRPLVASRQDGQQRN